MQLTSKGLSLSLERPHVMGILNVTPDSFSDGGHFNQLERAMTHARQMVAEGATLIDIGGESTRPGAPDVSEQEELDRVIPVVERMVAELEVMISLDTSKAAVMREGCAAGAHLINDVRALLEPGALAAAAVANVPVCLMHMQGQPRTMQAEPHYDDLLGEVRAFFDERIAACLTAGIEREQLLLDPGYGFGKTLAHNYQLLAQQEKLLDYQLPLLVGMSRKSMIGNLLGCPVDERLAGSLACALIGMQRGARIIRVHDVRATMDALRTGWMVMTGQDFISK
ncbi:dihydropteroate synthase [Aeromonas hydrophila]|uniref:Dihydropteroate synthase n=1 Tax=Aeromonas hydrophila subsp. hydrophila (strain ATCC 7966 / DSM 30187 / BCRC 13018 / CCUG 14551 / JCM 1027 / KCTC 2358 / NCIMB 9240 / NCTC 8049) TaxID=380703 RepID=A0KNE9_AERHH|nr:dihydropteroate synthase [Aeromonas hydrophila]ABK36170.1 dihydropteroate synthase [Aeromonas hydrophila subsp. hydrophila ATCC 7966]EIS3744499.1 dihydropteroate synthase [Aeromonas hydrophila]MBS4671779.1 dihydropteroate synthase [Aeromonas hydrophila]OOD35586.1 dihydropteroate synthase [Aeromonas hydrophila]SUU31452.1 dihydropteroate synthase [Aeromonas hydrophila]